MNPSSKGRPFFLVAVVLGAVILGFIALRVGNRSANDSVVAPPGRNPGASTGAPQQPNSASRRSPETAPIVPTKPLAPAHGFVVRVVTPRKDPVSQAAVSLRLHGTAADVGRTGPNGELAVPLGLTSAGSVTVVANDHPPTEAAFDFAENFLTATDSPPILEVELAVPARIRGMVRIGNESGPEGIRIVAYPDDAAPRAYYRAFQEILADPDTVISETDASGRFELTVDPKRRYALSAGGNGLIQVNGCRKIEPGTEDALVQLEFGYGLLLHLCDQEGNPARAPSVFSTNPPSFAARLLDPDGRDSQTSPLSAFLAGVTPLLDLRFELDSTHIFQFYSSVQEKPALGPIEVRAALPGYEPASLAVFASRAQSGISPVEIRMRQSAVAFGALIVRIHGGAPGMETMSSIGGQYFLDLQDLHGAKYRYRLQDWKDDVCRVEPVPTGRYGYAFVSIPNRATRHAWRPAGTIEVVEGKPSEVVVDWSTRSVAELLIKRGDGEPYTGVVAGDLSPPLEMPTPEQRANLEKMGFGPEVANSASYVGVEHFWFWAPPYRIQNLEPGEYVFRLKDADESGYVSVRIAAGETKLVTLVKQD